MNQKTVYCVIDKQGITDKDICCNAIKNAECSKIDGTALINFKNGIYKAEYVCFNEKIYFDSFINEYCKYTL